MDLKQIEYIIKIADENNITYAAKKLFISQSALNQQLIKLENELGVKLFYRSRTNWHPTEAGEVYINNARKILRIKQETYKIIYDLAETKRGHLSIGFPPGRGMTMFSNVYPAFHYAYPDVIVEPMELSVHRQQEMISKGNLDIGFMTLCDSDRTNDNYIKICSEEIVLAIPSKHKLSYLAESKNPPYTTIDISKLKSEPFILIYKESTNRKLIDNVFNEANFTPKILFETSNNEAILTMIRSGLSCGLLPEYYTRNQYGISCFSVQSKPTWDIVASYMKGGYLSQPEKNFISLATKFWTSPLYLNSSKI